LLQHLQSGKGASTPAAGLKWKTNANRPWQWGHLEYAVWGNLRTEKRANLKAVKSRFQKLGY